jgi:bifunctional UDP-N-acetylglucosamine pyrophosphorylase / glucosamine-1-phosphate N-acetyltransferase
MARFHSFEKDVVNVMAAGKGTRMKSALPKVLHRLAGRSLLQHVLDAAAPLEPQRHRRHHGHGAKTVESALASSGARFVRQMPQLGTGHAVQQAGAGTGRQRPRRRWSSTATCR